MLACHCFVGLPAHKGSRQELPYRADLTMVLLSLENWCGIPSLPKLLDFSLLKKSMFYGPERMLHLGLVLVAML